MGGLTGTGPAADGVDPQVLWARAYLSRVSEPANIPVWGFVGDVGPVEAVEAIRTGIAPREVLDATAARRPTADPDADLDAAERAGLRLVVPESADWPHFAMAALEYAGAERLAAYRAGGDGRHRESGEPIPPLALWARGPLELASLGVRSVGIVGSRAATAYGEQVSSEFAFALASAGVVVVSGGAYGIDAAAHRAALTAGGETVLVSAGGLDRPYPPGNATLFARVAEIGLLLSESPPGCAPQRHRFLTRNRLIAALSTGTVIVEAAKRSGARNTAAHCLALQRPLMAVPGPIVSPMSMGCHGLIRGDGGLGPALLVGSAADVLAVVGGAGEGLSDGADTGTVADVRAELDDLDPIARRVYEGLGARRFARPDEIGARGGVSPLEVIRALPLLELAGLVESSDAGFRIARRTRTRST
ncbi:MAG TPA: DNA-processing protein DprA [Jatrophihabitantaceae bacterium]|nr:DNA-processing protein DprA [Jatrophihabitantaceae bacterium]